MARLDVGYYMNRNGAINRVWIVKSIKQMVKGKLQPRDEPVYYVRTERADGSSFTPTARQFSTYEQALAYRAQLMLNSIKREGQHYDRNRDK